MLKYSLLAAIATLLLKRSGDPIDRDVADDEYDFIIVGSGPTGSVVASRLTEDPNIKVLLLEAGGRDDSDPRIDISYVAPSLMGTDLDWKYQTVKQDHAMGRWNGSAALPCGKVLGGSTTINFHQYVRGSPYDFDAWEDMGATGWGWREVEPYFRKFERGTDDGITKKVGRDGLLKLSSSKSQPGPLTTTYFDAAAELGFDEVDYNDPDNEIGISYITGTTYGGIRQSAVTAFLRPFASERRNRLHVLVEAFVTKVLISPNATSYGNPKAYGVQYKKNGKLYTVRARKEVILSAGVYNTPQIMMLSGIGDKSQLEKLGIPVILDSPGVGRGLHDHVYFIQPFLATNISSSAQNRELDYILKGHGLVAISNMKYRTKLSGTPKSASTSKRPSPEIQIILGNSAGPYNNVVVNLMLPKSRGSLKLRSTNPEDPPLIDPRYYADEDDFDVHVEGFRLLEKMEQTKAFAKAGMKMVMEKHCNGSQHMEIPRSEDYYRCIIKYTALAGRHTCCTAKIGFREDKYAVVDSRLRVYGVDGLRVADASVMPRVTTGNTQAPCYMIGEKSADMIKQDWGLN